VCVCCFVPYIYYVSVSVLAQVLQVVSEDNNVIAVQIHKSVKLCDHLLALINNKQKAVSLNSSSNQINTSKTVRNTSSSHLRSIIAGKLPMFVSNKDSFICVITNTHESHMHTHNKAFSSISNNHQAKQSSIRQ